jgi:predicted NAD/FAD-binding protein
MEADAMADDRMSDEGIVRAFPDEALVLLSARQRAALEHLLARLAAAEKVCRLVGDSLSPKRRAEQAKKTYWWDVAAAVKEWETAAKS